MSDSPSTPSDDTKAMHRHAEQQVQDLERRITRVEQDLRDQGRDADPRSPGEAPAKHEPNRD